MDTGNITVTTSSCIDYQPFWPDGGWFPTPLPMPYVQPYPSWTITVPTECGGDVHVFPCSHCDKCKCGKALKAKG